jgi:aryl-alcohol dehydrogenase-like predicted oxidoreductase
MTVAQIAMRYIFSNAMNMSAVISTLNPQRMERNIRASRMPFATADVEYLNLEK